MTDKYVFFYGGPFSQWYPAKFLVENIFNYASIEFDTAEQWMMFHKAMHFKDEASAEKILAEENPSKCKALGKKVANFNAEEWAKVAFNIVVAGNRYKFTQNEKLKQVLLKTKNKTLVEASPYDQIWGIGLSESDPRIFDETKWRGTNLLGKAIMAVREELNVK